MESSSSHVQNVYYPNVFFNQTSPINNIKSELPIMPSKKAKLYKPRSHLKISNTLTDISNPKKQLHNRSKTLTRINHLNGKSDYLKKPSKASNLFYSKSGFGDYLRAKSYSKKQIKMSNTSDLSSILSKHIYPEKYI